MAEAVLAPTWPRRRWLVLMALVFGGQLGLILWLGSRGPALARVSEPGAEIRLTGDALSEVVELLDPTLFALPKSRGFAGEAWLTSPPQQFYPFVWSEPPRWLALTADQLGTTLACLTASNQVDFPQLPQPPQPVLSGATLLPLPTPPTPGAVRVYGPLSRRKLLTAIETPAWTNEDLLTNTVLQVVIDPDGRPLSVTPVSSSGFGPADEYAYREGRRARFEPFLNQPNVSSGFTPGAMVFEWQTVPAPGTNKPAVR